MSVFDSDGSRNSVQALHDAAECVDGDTITLPPGTFYYSSYVAITKGIELMGATTVDLVAKTANDQTIILDDTNADWVPLLALAPDEGKTISVSGITFKKGSGTTPLNGGLVSMGGGQGTARVRLHHCHFFAAYRIACVYVGLSYGCIDHNLFSFLVTDPFTKGILARMDNWNGDTNGVGDRSFADYPWFGTEKFLFVEDNTFNNTSGIPLNGVVDLDAGTRIVVRHNHGYDWQVQNHGTENRQRGARAGEVYNNDFHFTSSTPLGGVRTGAYLYHDNTFDGVEGSGLEFNYLRSVFAYGSAADFWASTGDSPWDVNATEADGTHVDGHAPYLFDSGTVTSGSTTTIVDTTKNWTLNQWAQFTIKRVSDTGISMIVSNTSDTLTVTHTVTGEVSSPNWTAGDAYQIHKVLIALDQPGRGKGDLITGGYNDPGSTLNSVTGTEAWPHQALEPCYSWNNFYTGDIAKGFNTSNPAYLAVGVDYYNGSSSEAAVAKYVAALNGVDYLGPYTYPHPLVSDAITSIPGACRIGHGGNRNRRR